MTTDDLAKVTKAELASELATVREQAKSHAAAMEARERSRDGESRAIDACVKALDVLHGERRQSINYPFDGLHSAPTPVSRVLSYLHLRYGVPDSAAERDALRADLERTQRELDHLRSRFAQVRDVVQP